MYTELDQLVKSMTANPKLTIEIIGHTDNVGNRSANIALSEKRALKVSQYLMAHGVEKRRIKTVGYGPDKPLNGNRTEADRKLNRRVEFRISENGNQR